MYMHLGHNFSRVKIHSTPTMMPAAISRVRPIQTKLTISQPGDRYEQEADKIAEEVMRMPELRTVDGSEQAQPPHIRRSCPKCRKKVIEQHDEEELLQTKTISIARFESSANRSSSFSAPPIVQEVLHSSGRPLDKATRAFMEPRFGYDFSHVRVHTDALAERSTRNVNALAYVVGRDIVFGAGQYAPHINAGRHLLAHELAHVMQQGNNSPVEDKIDNATGLLARAHIHSAVMQSVLQRQETTPTEDKKNETPKAQLSVSLSRLTFTPERGAKYREGLSRPQCMAVILQHLIGSQYQPTQHLEDTILDVIEKRKPQNWPKIQYTGKDLRPNNHVPEGKEMGSFYIDTAIASLLIEFLKERFQKVELTPAQEELIQLGTSSYFLWLEIRNQVPEWYTLYIFQREMAQNADLLRQYSQPATPEAKGILVSTIAEAVLTPVRVMQALQNDPALATDQKVGPIYQVIWNVGTIKQGSKAQVQVPTKLKSEEMGFVFLRYVRTQPQISEQALKDRTARITLLERFGKFAASAHAAMSGDETLANVPSKANMSAHPAELSSNPKLELPLYQINQNADMLFMMKLMAPTALDYFAPYGFAWERLKVPADKLPKHEKIGGKQSKSDVLEREGKTLQATGEAVHGADPKKIKAQRVATGEFAWQRFSRTTQYAKEDIQKVISESGFDPGVSPLTLVGANALLRYLGTGIRLGLDLATKPGGLLESSKHVIFPGPGIYLVRCIAFPLLKGDEEIVRAPSVAYLPAFARDPGEISSASAAMAAAEQESVPSRIREIELELQAPLPANRRKQLQDELESLQSSQQGIGAVLRLQQKRLTEQRDKLKAQIESISEGKEQGSATKLVKELETVEEQLEGIKAELKTRSNRILDLTNSKPLIASFVGDKGQTISLNLEMVDKGELPSGKRSVYISDITTAKSGADTGEGKNLSEAIKDALSRILGSGQGYGRGQVSFALDGKIETLRITSTLGGLLNEAIENITLAVSVAAIAAAPFTSGATLAILIPVGMVGAIPSGYRLAESVRTVTFTLDFNSAMDIVNIASSFILVGQIGTAAKLSKAVNPSLRAMWVGRGLMIFGFGLNGLNVVLLGASVIQQIEDLKNKPENERAAELLSILGNVMIQVGMMIGHKLVGESHNLKGSKSGVESKMDSNAAGNEKAPGRFEGEAIDPRSSTKTTAGTIPGGGKPLSAVERESLVRNVRSKESLFEKLAQEGIRRNEPRSGSPPTTTIKPGKPRLGIKDAHEAYRLYDEALEANGGKNEVAIYYNPRTEEFSVSVGNETIVYPPSSGGWEGVLHYHPNPLNIKQFRRPAPADFLGMMRRFVSSGQSVREFLEYEIPGIGRGRTEFGITQGSKEPFYMTVFLPDGSSSTLRFAHDGTYSSYWSGEKIYVDPDSPLYKAMLADIPEYLKKIHETTKDSMPPKETASESKTAASTAPPKSPAKGTAPTLMTSQGDLTDEGVAFLRRKYPRRFGKKTPEEIRAEFAKDPGGRLLEVVGKEEVRSHHRDLGPGASSILLDKKKQKMRSLAKALSKRISVDTAPLNMPVLEFVRTYMPEALDFMDNHPNEMVRIAWLKFAWGYTKEQAEWVIGRRSQGKRAPRKGEKISKRGFLTGEVKNKEPDIIEVFPDRKLIIVTDTTHRVGDPIHNFKTLFYAIVMEKMTGFESGSVDYRSVLRQKPVELPAKGPSTP